MLFRLLVLPCCPAQGGARGASAAGVEGNEGGGSAGRLPLPLCRASIGRPWVLLANALEALPRTLAR